MFGECPVCFETDVSLVRLQTCAHTLCRICAVRVLLGNGMRCPYCRQMVIGSS